MPNFRNVVVGTSGLGNALEEWPELGDDQPKIRSKKHPIPVNIRPKLAAEKEEISVHLDTQEFPALRKDVVHKPRDSEFKVPEVGLTSVKKPKKRKIKRSTPIQVDICEIIQASALKKKQKCEIVSLQKSCKFKRKVIGGNHLDADQPKRHKGKVRPWKPRDLSKTKKVICASRKIRLERLNYTRDMLWFKENLGNALKVGNIDVDDLVKDLSEVRLDGTTVGMHKDQADINKTVRDLIHNKKFRSYCNNLVTPELKQYASELIATLRKFQDRMHAKDEIKAHAKRRYVCGFNESRKFLLADKVKLLLVATNLEMEEGLPSMDILKRLVDAADERKIPVVYAGLGQNIGYWTLKKTKISVLAVMNYEGANDAHDNLMKSWLDAKEEYNKLTNSIVDLCSSKSPELISAEEVKDKIEETILKKLKEITATK